MLLSRMISALQSLGANLRHVNMYAGGGWKITIVTRGGMIAGQPEIRFDDKTQELAVFRRKLFGRCLVKKYFISDELSCRAATNEVCKTISGWGSDGVNG